MRTLVTGGAGFIGSNLVDALLDRGDAVVAADDLSTGRRENLTGAEQRGARFVPVDIADGAAVRDLVEDAQPDVVFHLAAQVDVRRSLRDPLRDLAVNAGGTLNVLGAARAAGTRRLVYASTGGAIYGNTHDVPTPEDHPARPLAPYGQSKYAGEGYCRLYADLHGLRITALRLANVYGPRQDPLGEGGVVAIFCGRLASGRPAAIFGDGEQTRDFVYVGDVVAALLAASGHEGFGPYNVGTGRETSVNELARLVSRAADRPFEPVHEPERPGEVRRSCLDVSRAAAELGWRAATPLEEGLRRTLAWTAGQSPS